MPSIEAMLMTLAGRSARGGLERRMKRLGEKERRLEVEVHDFVPALFGKGIELGEPRGAGVVDENVELRLAHGQRRGERADALDRREVGRHGKAGAALFRQFRRGLLALRRLAGGDIDPRALSKEAARNHLADAAGAAGDEGAAALKRKQIGHHRQISFMHALPVRRPAIRAPLRSPPLPSISAHGQKQTGSEEMSLVLPVRIELTTSPLPRAQAPEDM